ncbi:MAG: PilZ domain-containing protein [Nitrospiraceae bacterium]
MELRYAQRYPVECPITFSGNGTTGQGTVINVSMNGWKVSSAQGVPKGTFLSLRVSLPDVESPVEVDLTEVRWTSDQEFGLVTLRMRDEERERLGNYISTLELPQAEQDNPTDGAGDASQG